MGRALFIAVWCARTVRDGLGLFCHVHPFLLANYSAGKAVGASSGSAQGQLSPAHPNLAEAGVDHAYRSGTNSTRSMTTPDPYNLQRFIDAQRGSYEQAVKELTAGHKQTHWMWYIFPQIQGLGRSSMAQKYAVSSLDEAKAYLEHPILGPRLRECAQLVTAVKICSIKDILGYPDDLKFHSSMTLFAHATADNQIFIEALKKYYRSEFDCATTRVLML
jgi:uncharacterized protein (DUF1810 family)